MKICTGCINSNNNHKLFCENCGKIQEIKLGGKTSIFSIFGFESSLDIKKNILDKKYSELISLMHPDRFINRTENERLIAEVNTATINHAYKTLSSEVGICEYILNNVKKFDNDEIINNADEFLIEKIALYEELNIINSTDKCIIFKNKLSALYYARLSDIRSDIGQKQWANAFRGLQKIKFIQNLLDALEKKAYMLEMDEKLHKK